MVSEIRLQVNSQIYSLGLELLHHGQVPVHHAEDPDAAIPPTTSYVYNPVLPRNRKLSQHDIVALMWPIRSSYMPSSIQNNNEGAWFHPQRGHRASLAPHLRNIIMPLLARAAHLRDSSDIAISAATTRMLSAT